MRRASLPRVKLSRCPESVRWRCSKAASWPARSSRRSTSVHAVRFATSTKARWRRSAAGALKLSGFMAWLAWLTVHIFYLIDFRSKVVVLFDWAWSYFTYQRGSRLITGHRLDAGAPERMLPMSKMATAPVVPTPAVAALPAASESGGDRLELQSQRLKSAANLGGVGSQ